jgi:hypothetical protein
MCTVTYLPLQDGFILTHNRDETPGRSESPLERRTLAGTPAIFPKDPGAGGTWMACTTDGRACCLLNGAFVKHKRALPYRKSRGLLALEALECREWQKFIDTIDLGQIEPFTLLLFAPGKAPMELRWDGARKHQSQLKQDPHFWCSPTLYPPAMRKKREQVFSQWLEHHPMPWSPESIRQLHLVGSVGDPRNDYVMNRDDRVRTISITQIWRQKNRSSLQHLNLISNHSQTQTLPAHPYVPYNPKA